MSKKIVTVVGALVLVVILGVVLTKTHVASVFKIQTPTVDKSQPIQLTQAEEDYVHTHMVTMGHPISIRPLVYQDGNDAKGLSIDYAKLIAKKTGLAITFVPFSTQAEVLSAIKDHKVDLGSTIVPTPERAEYMAFTDSYVNLNAIFLVNQLPIDFPMKVGFGGKYAVEATIRKMSSSIVPISYPNDDIAFNALMAKNIGAIILDQSSADYLEDKYNKHFARTLVDFYYTVGFGCQLNNPTLCSIMSKGIRSITNSERAEIEDRDFVKRTLTVDKQDPRVDFKRP